MADIARDFELIARQLASNDNNKNAFDMYMCAIDKYPNIWTEIENEFRFVLSKISEDLAIVENMADIFGYFERAIRVYPGNVNLLNDIGRYINRYGFVLEALRHFEMALNMDSSNIAVEKNLNNAKCFLFPRSKFRILNDKILNDAYRAAIRSCVNRDTDSVIDISAGTGLVALYANECNPIAITGCESSHAMERLVECVMQENLAHNVVIVKRVSVIISQLDIILTILCATRTILLTDMFEAGLFGNYIFQENLVYRGTNTGIIPGKAEFFVVGVNCAQLNSKYKLSQHIKDLLNVPRLHLHTTTYSGETYYSEDVELYDDITYICEPHSLFTIDFNSRKEVTQIVWDR